MTQENVEKIGFFKRVWLAITDFDKYGVLAAENMSVAVMYLLKIILILAIVISGIFVYQFHNSFQGATNYFEKNIDQVQYADGSLEINQGNKIEIQNEDAVVPYILIHTGATQEEIKDYQDDLRGYATGLLILKDKIIYRNELLNQNMEYSYSNIAQNYQIGEFDKQGALDFISQIDKVSLYTSIFIIMLICSFIMYLTTTFVDIMMLALLGFIVGRIAGMKIRFRATFNIGVYALTLPILLNIIYVIINAFTGFTISYFQWMYTTISYIYVIVSILMIKADFINKQAELMKIIEEQERVREEMKLREEQKKKEEEKNQNKDNKDEEQEKQTEPKKKKTKKEKDELGTDRISTTRNT